MFRRKKDAEELSCGFEDVYKYNKKEGKIDQLSHIYSREILFTSICWFRKEEADSTNFSSASVV